MVLVTGGAGFIGSVLVSRILATTDWKVIVMDNLMHDGRAGMLHFLNHPDRFSFKREDIRTMDYKVLDSCDYVVNLAALVGEPLCKKNEDEAWHVNYDAAVRLALECNHHLVKRYLFSSTCSNYGVKKELATELDELNPVSLYAETKVETERVIFGMDSTATDVTIMRFATAFGLSLRNRFDLLLQEFIK
ncbi:MAG: NAD-dependent epimerase/dehydratase family protein, partial [Nitrososphaerales archaeon]